MFNLVKQIRSMIDPSINLKCYTVRIRKKREKDKFLNLNNNLFENKDFYTVVQEFIKHIETEPFVNSTQDKKLYFVGEIGLDSTQRIITGTLKKGWSGKESDIVSINDNTNKVIFKQLREHASTNPFYFMLAMPEKVSFGILIVQSFKYFGMKEILEDALKRFFAKNYKEFVCEIFSLANPALFDKMLDNGGVKQITLKQHAIAKNIEDQLDQGVDPKNVEIEVVIKAKKRDGFLDINNKIKSFKKNNTSFLELIKIDGFKHDMITADVVLNRNRRKLDMLNPDDFGSFYDVTDQVETDSQTGHPIYTSINKIARDIYLNDILPTLK